MASRRTLSNDSNFSRTVSSLDEENEKLRRRVLKNENKLDQVELKLSAIKEAMENLHQKINSLLSVEEEGKNGRRIRQKLADGHFIPVRSIAHLQEELNSTIDVVLKRSLSSCTILVELR